MWVYACGLCAWCFCAWGVCVVLVWRLYISECVLCVFVLVFVCVC